MLRRKWPNFKTICMAVDFCLILIAYYAAFTLRHDVMGGTVTVDVIHLSVHCLCDDDGAVLLPDAFV